jgi:hypothetical protein
MITITAGKTNSPRILRGVAEIIIVMSALVTVAACSSKDHTQSTAYTGNLPLQASASPLAGIEVQISPTVTPSFDPSILDYVVDCSTGPTVQFTARMPPGAALRLLAYGSDPSVVLANPSGNFQTTLYLVPGQRFRFAFAQSTFEYSVRCLPVDFPPLSVTTSGVPQAEWYVFAPSISFAPAGAPSSYVVITDSNGTPIWWKEDKSGGGAVDAKILDANEIAWTAFTSSDVGGHFVVRGFDGQIINVVSGNLDFHDLQVTPAGTYLAIRYVPRVCPPDCADMSPWGGSAQAAVVDAEIVELDKGSNVLWTWKTRDHIALSETGNSGFFPAVANDIIHMNAVEPDGSDGVLFSARHLSAIYHITKSTGAVDWKIGGTTRPESLTVIGDLRPTAMGVTGSVLSGQHDVRKWPDGTISVHDNGTIANRPPFVVRYKIDTVARTADVVEEFGDARVTLSVCCGSARRLPNGHWLVAWGDSPFLTELDSGGSPVLTIQYNLGGAFSYRAVPVLPGLVSASAVRDGMDAMVVRHWGPLR